MVTKTVGPPSPDVPRPRDGVDVGPVGTETETLYGRVLGRVGDTAVTVGPAETSGGGVGRPLWGLAEGGGLGARGPVGHWTTVGAQRAVPAPALELSVCLSGPGRERDEGQITPSFCQYSVAPFTTRSPWSSTIGSEGPPPHPARHEPVHSSYFRSSRPVYRPESPRVLGATPRVRSSEPVVHGLSVRRWGWVPRG